MSRVLVILLLLLGLTALAGAQGARTEVTALDHFVVVARTGYSDAPAFPDESSSTYSTPRLLR